MSKSGMIEKPDPWRVPLAVAQIPDTGLHRDLKADQAICAAVGPYGWRALTAEMVVRRLLGAEDRLLIVQVIGETRGASARDLGTIEPVDRSDDRIEPLGASQFQPPSANCSPSNRSMMPRTSWPK